MACEGGWPWKYAARVLFVLFAATGMAAVPAAARAGAGAGQPLPLVVKTWRELFARPKAVAVPVGNSTAVAVPVGKSISAARIALGQALFHDTRLSGNGQRSCASCHQADRGFSDGRAKGAGLMGGDLARNTPSLYNLAWATHFYWDGREASLEAQARVPIQHPNEMNGDFAVILKQLGADRSMMRDFARAFPRLDISSGTAKLTVGHVVKALAAYERSLLSPVTRFDRWVAGDDAAMTVTQFSGFRLFVGKAGCVGCHVGWRFTDNKFHNIGLPGDDLGRGAIRGGVPGLASFKTPGLREALHSAPYMHDGSLSTLEAVINHYSGGFVKQRNLSTNMVRDLALSALEKAQLLAFLKTLSHSGN